MPIFFLTPSLNQTFYNFKSLQWLSHLSTNKYSFRNVGTMDYLCPLQSNKILKSVKFQAQKRSNLSLLNHVTTSMITFHNILITLYEFQYVLLFQRHFCSPQKSTFWGCFFLSDIEIVSQHAWHFLYHLPNGIKLKELHCNSSLTDEFIETIFKSRYFWM